ncbi:MAG TPA: glycerol-3-phosphate dehydrogenase C-terminal domain-containing protein, partial [Candidatus Kapabacteria bacterium]|nr:glycerol-3-phosphate dehydrogenase C-terminal domain-containing protein [Candidatus Kapabacteria bacterium]
LQLAQQAFPGANVTAADVISSYAGVRPVISKNRSKDPSKEKRDHQVWVDKGLVSVSGGKLTTFRLIARDTLQAAKPFLQGVEFRNQDEQLFDYPIATPHALGLQDKAWAQRMIGRYGDQVKSLLQDAPESERNKIAGTEFCLAELRWSCRNEQIVHLDDLLLRRTRLGLLLHNGGAEILPHVKEICQQELDWNQDRWHSEEQRYLSLWRHYYFLPDATA